MLETTIHNRIMTITLNRPEKYNAFNDIMLQQLVTVLDEAELNPDVQVIIINAAGKHFCAGADIGWMQRMSTFSPEENLADAKVLAAVMYKIHTSTHPVIAMVQGSAWGGGAGIVAAADIAIAAEDARFCFSEVKLNLVPAVISPYVIRAIGSKQAGNLFLTGDIIDAQYAHRINLVQHVVKPDELAAYTREYAEKLLSMHKTTLAEIKNLVNTVEQQPITPELTDLTAQIIAEIRSSPAGQSGIHTFLQRHMRKGNV